MYEYKDVIHRLRQKQTHRSISRETTFGRNKSKEINQLSPCDYIPLMPLAVDDFNRIEEQEEDCF